MVAHPIRHFTYFLGVSLWAYAGQPFQTAYYGLMAHELIEDPNDILIQLAGAVLGQVPYYITHFLSAYLIFWGLVDVSLSVSLLKEKLWAFPVSIILISIFMLYELYRLSYTHSITLGVVIIIDGFIIWLINKKYQQVKLDSSSS